MISKIENWIDVTLDSYKDKKVSCAELFPHLKDSYPIDFLTSCYFVVTDNIPKPDYPELRSAGLGDFIDMDVDGITYKNTYFLKSQHKGNLALHVHELVHVVQWQLLGAEGFIRRYIEEIDKYGYLESPLEKMAYSIVNHFSNNGDAFNIPLYVKEKI